MKALGTLALKKKELIPVLIAAMKDDMDFGVRSRAQSALFGLGEEIIPKMIAMLKEKESLFARQGATYVLAQLGPKAKDAVPLLIDGTKDKDYMLKQRSLQALAKIGPDARTALPVLVDLFEVSFVEGKAAIAAGEKPMPTKGGPDGGHFRKGSVTRQVLDAILAIDPDPQGVVQSHVSAMDRLTSSDAKIVPRLEEIQTALRQRYPREKK